METIEAFLTLVRLGIGNYASALPKEVDWAKVRDIAEQQGLYAVVLDGIEKLPQSYRPPQEICLNGLVKCCRGMNTFMSNMVKPYLNLLVSITVKVIK